MPDSEVLATLLRLRQVVSAMGEQIAAGPVSEPQTVAEVRARISGLFDLSRPSSPDELVERIVERLAADTVQVTHPRYFGLFNPAVPPITVVADALVAMFNPQLAAWEHSPAAQEMERLVLGALGGLVGLDLDGGMAHFTSGGAEANGTATLAALVAAFPDLPETGLRALPAQPTLYLSGQAHDTFVKIAVASGLGRRAVRRVPVDDDFRMDVAALRDQLRRDRARGEQPFLVVATAGTTSTGVIDPLESILEVAREQHVWMHADAAWGGGALLSERLRPALVGMGRPQMAVGADGRGYVLQSPARSGARRIRRSGDVCAAQPCGSRRPVYGVVAVESSVHRAQGVHGSGRGRAARLRRARRASGCHG